MTNLPSWWNRDRERQNQRSRKQERQQAEQVGGKVQRGSGSSWRAPQDVKGPDYLDQLKYTDKRSYSIKVSEWKALVQDALNHGREPRMIVSFPQEGITVQITEVPDAGSVRRT